MELSGLIIMDQCGVNRPGEVDDTLLAVRVTADAGGDISGNGRVMATITNYGCHPQSLGPENSLVSADWPGTTRELLESTFGGAYSQRQGTGILLRHSSFLSF